MTTKFFSQCIKDLQESFGEHNFSLPKQKLIWREVRDLPDNDFKKIVELCIGEFNIGYPPGVSWFRERSIERRKIIQRKIEQEALENYKAQVESRELFTKEGKEKALKEAGLKSLMEAITKTPRGGSDGSL